MKRYRWLLATCLAAVGAATAVGGAAAPSEKTERFDRDPGWEGVNNRTAAVDPRTVRQAFGYSRTQHAGKAAGEIGGFVTPAAEAAYYAKPIPAASFATPLEASGTLACADGEFHALIAFFDANSINGWRTPNTIALRISGRGKVFYTWLEYCTTKWRAGGDSPRSFPVEPDPERPGRTQLKGFASGLKPHPFTLRYDPKGNEGRGSVIATVDGVEAVCNLDDGHKEDGAVFNRFGVINVMKSADTGGEFWIDDVKVNGVADSFDADPRWEGVGNQRSFVTKLVRPLFDFGFTDSQFAGGERPGELGGVLFRGDCRYRDRIASYADRIAPISLEHPFRAAGKLALRRGVSDSGVLLGFFNAQESMRVNPSQDTGLPLSFVGISTDAPSREGFYFAPTYRLRGDGRGSAAADHPRIYPDGKSHTWRFDYSPEGAGGLGEIAVRVDAQKVCRIALKPGEKSDGTRLDRFGMITAWVDGNSQSIFFDDLTYTARQE